MRGNARVLCPVLGADSRARPTFKTDRSVYGPPVYHSRESLLRDPSADKANPVHIQKTSIPSMQNSLAPCCPSAAGSPVWSTPFTSGRSTTSCVSASAATAATSSSPGNRQSTSWRSPASCGPKALRTPASSLTWCPATAWSCYCQVKRAQFFKPGSIFIERQMPREGPSPVFICWKPDTSQTFTDEKKLLKFCAWPKSTPTGTELREWLRSFDGIPVEKPELDVARIEAEGFGPEAHAEPDPTTNTKMIT